VVIKQSAMIKHTSGGVPTGRSVVALDDAAKRVRSRVIGCVVRCSVAAPRRAASLGHVAG
jgi:hypothetical protein